MVREYGLGQLATSPWNSGSPHPSWTVTGWPGVKSEELTQPIGLTLQLGYALVKSADVGALLDDGLLLDFDGPEDIPKLGEAEYVPKVLKHVAPPPS